MPRRDQAHTTNPGSPLGTSQDSRTSSACLPSTGDSWGTAGRLLEVGSGACGQVRTLFAAVSGPASARRRALAARTGAQPVQIDSDGTWALASECLKRCARARATFPGSRQSPELSPNPSLVSIRTLQQCRYRRAALLSESWREHLRTTFRAPAKANWFETTYSRREKST